MQFEADNRVDARASDRLIQRPARDYRMEGPLKLRITRSLPKPEQRFEYAQRLLEQLAGDAA